MSVIARALGLLAIVLATSFAAGNAQAAGPCGIRILEGKKTIVLFVNGINNDLLDACASSDALAVTLRNNAVPIDDYSYSYFWNPSDGAGGTLIEGFQAVAGDMIESVLQALLSNEASSESLVTSDYYRILGRNYSNRINGASSPGTVVSAAVKASGTLKLGFTSEAAVAAAYTRVLKTTARLHERLRNYLSDPDKKIVVVAHSQGNFYIEAAYAMLSYQQEFDIARRVRVVGVAVPAATSPNGRYISSTQDQVVTNVRAVRRALGDSVTFDVRPETVVPCVGSVCDAQLDWAAIDGLAHGFTSVYLNSGIVDRRTGKSFAQLTSQLIGDALAELKVSDCPKVNSPTSLSGSLTAVVGQSAGFSTSLTGSTLGSASFLWDFGDGTQSQTPAGLPNGPSGRIAHTFQTPGTRRVAVTPILADGTNCPGAFTDVTVSSPVAPPVLGSIVSTAPGGAATAGTAASFVIAGTNLPASLRVSGTGCTGLPVTTTTKAFSCTPSSAGAMVFTVADAASGASIGTATIQVTDAIVTTGWCNQDLTFDTNTVPSNWRQSLIRLGPGMANGRLEATVTPTQNNGVRLDASPIAMGSDVTKIVATYDALHISSAFGITSGIELMGRDGIKWGFYVQNASTPPYGGSIGFAVRKDTGLFGAETANAATLFQQVLYGALGTQHVEITVSNTLASIVVSSKDVPTLRAQTQFALPAGFSIAQIVSAHPVLYATTVATWMDTVGLKCLP